MPRSRSLPLLALALLPGLFGFCPGSCGVGVKAVEVEAPNPSLGGGIASLNGFVENKGQWPDEVLFFARRGGVEATVLRDALAFRPVPPSEEAPAPAPLVFHLPGDVHGRIVEGLDRLVTKHHFLVGDRQASDAAGFDRVALRGVLPGVDVVLRSDGGAFEYDLALAPGASLEDFVVEVEGAGFLEAREPNVLVLHTEAGEVEQRIRASWQGGLGKAVACRFRVLEAQGGRQRFGFEAPTWDRDLALVLDPTLVYLTYVGGASHEHLREVEVGPSGTVYLLAHSFGGLPVTTGALKSTPSGSDAWVGQLSPDGSTLKWATYIGGSGSDEANDFALAPDGSVVVLGSTWSSDFPTTPGAYQTIKGGTFESDVFVARLDPLGSSLLWATFYGGADFETGWACALYPGNDVLVAIKPMAAQLPSTPGAIDEVFDGEGDQALFRLSADGTQRLWQTYFRASTIDDLLVDDEGHAYFGGAIFSQDAPLMTTTGAFKEVLALSDNDGFVTKINFSGTQLIWSTYLGGEPNGGASDDRVNGLALDASQAVYVCGYTRSDTFPTTAGAFQTGLSGSWDGFAAKILPHGSGLAWSTYVGAWGFAGATIMEDVRVDAAGNAIVFGSANEPNFPVTPDAFQPFFIGPLPSSSDTLLCKLDGLGQSLVYATWLGGTGTDNFCELAMDSTGDAYVAFVAGPGLATTPTAYQPGYAGTGDLSAAKFDFDLLPWTILSGGLAGKDVPTLVGLGPLTTGSTTRLALRGAPAVSSAWIVAGLLEIDLPLLGGTLVPFPTVVVPASTGAQGELDFTFPWPNSPAGTPVFFQVWTPDAAGPQGWSASHALKAVSQ